MRVIFGAVTVKNAVLMYDNGNYCLQHYTTNIFEISNNVVTVCRNAKNNGFISMSSSRAISQALDHLRLPIDTKVGDQI